MVDLGLSQASDDFPRNGQASYTFDTICALNWVAPVRNQHLPPVEKNDSLQYGSGGTG